MSCCWRFLQKDAETKKEPTKEERAILKIQRAVRLDPITLQRMRGPVYALTRNGVVLLFDAHNLHSYIFRTGDLRDPVAREGYTLAELKELQQISGRPFPQSPNTMIRACPPLLSKVLSTRRKVCVELLHKNH